MSKIIIEIDSVYCIKEFTFKGKDGKSHTFKVGNKYEYWNNFEGLNHFVRYCEKEVFPFDGDMQMKDGVTQLYDRPYIFEYFCFKDEHRDSQLNKLGV